MKLIDMSQKHHRDIHPDADTSIISPSRIEQSLIASTPQQSMTIVDCNFVPGTTKLGLGDREGNANSVELLLHSEFNLGPWWYLIDMVVPH